LAERFCSGEVESRAHRTERLSSLTCSSVSMYLRNYPCDRPLTLEKHCGKNVKAVAELFSLKVVVAG